MFISGCWDAIVQHCSTWRLRMWESIKRCTDNTIGTTMSLRRTHPAKVKRWPTVILMLGQRRRQWFNIVTTVVQCLVCAGQRMCTLVCEIPTPSVQHDMVYKAPWVSNAVSIVGQLCWRWARTHPAMGQFEQPVQHVAWDVLRISENTRRCPQMLI